MAIVARRVKVLGRVQGVFFRAFTRDLASRAGVRGYVCNVADGSVEAWLEGEEDGVAAVIEGLREGPPAASVERVDVTGEVATGRWGDFRILR